MKNMKKLRLNKMVMNQMKESSEELYNIVKHFREQHHIGHIFVKNENYFYTNEDADYTAINIINGKSHTARAGGEWAGLGDFMPNRQCEIPFGCLVVERRIFLGKWFVTIIQNMENSPIQVLKLAAV